jgi:parvulin-like peptidyl-prolyl isomerase
VAPTRESGGELGAVALDALHADLRRAISGLSAGEIAEPVVLGGAVRVLKLNERTEARTTPYEEAREEISRRLRQERFAREYDTYMTALRKDSVIDLRVREVPHTLTVPVLAEPTLIKEPQAPIEDTSIEWASPPPAPPPAPAK